MSFRDWPVGFYLKNREQLELWFELRTEAAQALDAWLSGLWDDFEALAGEIGGGVQPINNSVGVPVSGLYLKRNWWPGTRIDDQPLLGIEWTRRKMLFGPETSPYVCIRSDSSTAIGRALVVDSEFQLERRHLRYGATSAWPAWGYVVPTQKLPDEEDDYRRMLLGSIRTLWTSFARFVDRAVEATTSNPTEEPAHRS